MKRVLKAILILVVGLSIGSGAGYIKLRLERGASARKVHEMEQQTMLLQKKYTEQKALEAQWLRTKVALEGQKRSVQSEIERVEEEKKTALAERNRLSEECKALQTRISALEEKIKSSQEAYAGLNSEKEDLEKQRVKESAEHKKELARAELEKKRMESDLNASLRDREQSLSRCVSHNQKLSSAARELLDRYEGKGVFGSLLQKEPFTQIRRVEVENLMDEYRSKIEEGTLDKKGKKSN